MAESKSNFDPGFGTRFKRRTKRVINKDGSFNVDKIGAKFNLGDAYLYFINLGWWSFIGHILLGYLVINASFASLYWLLGEGAIQAAPTDDLWGGWLSCFYFSTQTFTTVGYGAMSPVSHTASLVASLEALVGFLSFSLATGLLFGRFSKPRAKIRYSRHALLGKVNGTRSIVFRIVNERPNDLMEMSATVLLSMVRKESNDVKRTFESLELQISRIEFFPLNWTIVHTIDEKSPFFGMSDQEITQTQGELLIHVKGFDEMFAQILHSRFSYELQEIIPGRTFVRMFETNEMGEIVLDLSKIDETVPEAN